VSDNTAFAIAATILMLFVGGIMWWVASDPGPCKTFTHNITGTQNYKGHEIRCFDGDVVSFR